MIPRWTDGKRTLYQADWRDVPIPDGAVILTDPELDADPAEVMGDRSGIVVVNLSVWGRWEHWRAADRSSVWDRDRTTSQGHSFDAILGYGKMFDLALLSYGDHGEPTETEHPSERNLESWTDLMDRLPDGPVFDPYGGTGTTLLAAIALGREAVACEISADFCDMAVHRLDTSVFWTP